MLKNLDTHNKLSLQQKTWLMSAGICLAVSAASIMPSHAMDEERDHRPISQRLLVPISKDEYNRLHDAGAKNITSCEKTYTTYWDRKRQISESHYNTRRDRGNKTSVETTKVTEYFYFK